MGVKVKLNISEVAKLLRSSEVEEEVHNQAKRIQGRLGDRYKTDTKMMSSRVIASVYSEDPEAIRDNFNHNTLLKAVHQ